MRSKKISLQSKIGEGGDDKQEIILIGPKQTDWIFAELAALTSPYILVFLPATFGSLVVRISKPMMTPTFQIASFFTFLEVAYGNH